MFSSKEFIPLSVPIIGATEKKYVNECLDSGWVSTAGPWVDRFEKEFAKVVGASSAVSVTSGTGALHLALLAAGVGPGDFVLVPTLTFIAPVNAVTYVGATPIFLDCDRSLNLDLQAVEAFLKTSSRKIKAIIAVHVHGNLVDIARLCTLADAQEIQVIEDATESLGSEWLDSKKAAGMQGHFGCYSFNGNKILTAGGGGMVVAADPAQEKYIRHLSTQAKKDPIEFDHDDVGYNYRLTSLQAALGIAQLEQLEKRVHRKREIHALYQKLIEKKDLGQVIPEVTGTKSNHWLSAVRLMKPIALREVVSGMREEGIEVRPIWKLNHLQKPYVQCEAYHIKNAPVELARCLTVPSTPDLTDEHVSRVVESLAKVCETVWKKEKT